MHEQRSLLYCKLAGVPSVARDDQSRNPMVGVIFWYKEKGQQKLWKCVAIAIHYSPPCSVIRFPRLHMCCCLLRIFDALPTVQKMRSKNVHQVCVTSHKHVPESRTKCCRRRAWRGCRTPPIRRRKCLLERHACDVTQKRSRITDIMRQQPSSAQHRARSWERRWERSKRYKILGLYIPYSLFQTKGEMYAKSGWDQFRNMNLYKVQTYKQTFSFTYKVVHPPVV